MIRKIISDTILKYPFYDKKDRSLFRARLYTYLLKRELTSKHRPYLVENLFTSPLGLKPQHVKNCRLYADRYEMYCDLPMRGKICEVGVQFGHNTRKIVEICNPDEMHLVDWNLNRLESGTIPVGKENIFYLHEGWSHEILPRLPDYYFDWIYIDANHTYDAVKLDADIALTKIRKDGYLVFNDYIVWSYKESIPYGVVDVVNDLCINHNMHMVYFALSKDMYCDVALKRRD